MWGPSTSVGLFLLPSGGGGGTLDFKWRGWSKDFLGFEIFYSGIFLGGKIWPVFFGWLDLSRDILDIQTIWRFVMVPTYLRNLQGLEIQHGIFVRFIFGPGIFGGFDICSHSIITAVWNPKYPPWYCSLRYFTLLSFFFSCARMWVKVKRKRRKLH